MQLNDKKMNRKWREKLADEESPPCSGTLTLLEQTRGECRSRWNKHSTFFSGENLRGSTMYKSSGPTREGREGLG